jgi:hypothetical protein
MGTHLREVGKSLISDQLHGKSLDLQKRSGKLYLVNRLGAPLTQAVDHLNKPLYHGIPAVTSRR